MKNALLSLVLAISLLGSASGQVAGVDTRAKITVSGEAVVQVVPDKILVTFGIETWDQEDIVEAKKKNNNILKKALASIEKLEIPRKDVQTDHLSIEPRYRSNYPRDDFLGYFVRNSFVVTLTDVETLEPLVTQALEDGVNYVHGVTFQTSEFKKYREQARELALMAALEKANKMAGVLGQRAGAPIQINENHGGYGWFHSNWSGWGYGRGSGMTQNVIQNIPAASPEASGTIALGKLPIQANVTVTFLLIP